MGVPKFFRYMSERYPCLSELVKDYQIPDFDNLYLDMNGIIHVCSHPNDFDPTFRITEEKIFASIFHYIEILFNMIKPRKLFFMAVDGVAPRAKMNQQRGRRFKSAKEAEVLEKKALERGEKLPDAPRFDSNCITPGTVFMDRLQKQLQYFIMSKVSNDPLWQECKIILSGHETPGEGEHKIMDYIRYLKTLPEYDSNTRHCLYGLDADLIMLGLCTHEPHFSLLREEVKYGKQQNKRISSPEETKFFLLHLSLMREYLDLEFQELKTRLPFEYNLENIIDDWVLMGFLVGNDFIPHLPDLHINKGALPVLYKAYIEVLPTLTGYLNENGFLNLPRFQAYMERLGEFDMDTFEETYADLKAFEEKTGRKWATYNGDEPKETNPKSELEDLIKATNQLFSDTDDGSGSADEFEGDTFLAEFCQHKRAYYRTKLDYEKVDDEVMKSQAEGYIRALQWNLHYYYHGCKSWSWYYPHHYSPYISDIVNFKDLKLDFELGEPFLPFEQLLAVLPAGSKNLLPEAYEDLMTSPNSPIIDFYPKDFDTDLNGKQQDWEAVVLIPFIDEKRLLQAMAKCNENLTEEEKNRNKHGPMHVYIYTSEDQGSYKSPEYFPTVVANHALMQEVWREEIAVDISQLQFGLRPGVLQDVYFPGFPTLKHIPHTGSLKKAKVKVFEHASRGDSIILTIKRENDSDYDMETLANTLLGNTVYVNWPHMVEARILGVSNGSIRYNLIKNDNGQDKMEKNELDSSKQHQFNMSANVLQTYYYEKLGVDVGETSIIIYGNSMEGRKYVFGSSKKITYDKMWAKALQPYLFQVSVKDIAVHNPMLKIYQTVEEAFSIGSTVFMLGHPFYGSKGTIADSKETLKNGRLKIVMEIVSDPMIDESVLSTPRILYMPGNTASQRVGISSHMLSRITGSILIDMTDKDKPSAENTPKMNIGLNLKFNKKNEEVPGYTKKDNGLWTYSTKAVDLVNEYVEKYPHVIEHLSCNSKNDYFFRKDIFPDPDGVDEVKKMMDWLKGKDYNSIERTECGTEVLDGETIKALENLMDNFEPKNSLRNIQVKPHLLYKNDLLLGNLPPVPSAHHRILDRVVSVRFAYTVPVGLRGYIIGIHKAPIQADYQYDILFDKPFPNGMTINSTAHRAYRTSHLTFINISHGERLSQTKTNTVAYAPSVQQPANFNLRTTNRERAGSAFAQWNHVPPKPIEEKDIKFEQLWKNLQAPKPPQDETNMLKQLLKIDEKPKTDEKPKIEEPVKSFFERVTKNPENLTPHRKEERFDSIKAFLESAAQKQPEKNYYAQLFSYFQMKNLGQPRFNFLEVGTKVMAQIRLPDGSVYTGLPCDMKDSACESAALQVLGSLGEIPFNSDSFSANERPDNPKIIENQNKLEKGLRSKEPDKKSDKPKTSGGTRSFYNKNYQRQTNCLQSLPTPPLQWFGHNNAATFNQPAIQMQQHPFYKSGRNDPPFMMSDGYGKPENVFLPPWMSNEQMPNPFKKTDGRNRPNEQPRPIRKNDSNFDKRNQNDFYKKNDRKRDQNDLTNANHRQRHENGQEGSSRDSEPGPKQSSSAVQDGKPSSRTTEFIPLQAVTKTRVRGAIPITPVKQTQDATKDTVVTTVEQTNQQSTPTTAKPKRKPRIAANFGPAWDPDLC